MSLLVYISFLFILLFGIYALISSPTVYAFDKTRDLCIKKTKYKWQTEYKTEKLCKISDIKEVAFCGPKDNFSSHFYLTVSIYLKLKTKQSITLISHFCGRTSAAESAKLEFYAETLNLFLKNNNKKYKIEDKWSDRGWGIIITFFLLLTLIFCIEL